MKTITFYLDKYVCPFYRMATVPRIEVCATIIEFESYENPFEEAKAKLGRKEARLLKNIFCFVVLVLSVPLGLMSSPPILFFRRLRRLNRLL